MMKLGSQLDRIESLCSLAALLVVSIGISACRAASSDDPQSVLTLQEAQKTHGFVIGGSYQGYLEFFDSLAALSSRSTQLPMGF